MIYDEAMSILNDGHRVKRKSWPHREWLMLAPSVLDLTSFAIYRCVWLMIPLGKKPYIVTIEDKNALDWQALIETKDTRYRSIVNKKLSKFLHFRDLSNKKHELIVDNWTQV